MCVYEGDEGGMKEKKLWHVFYNSAVTRNAIFAMVLGMCPTLATSTSAFNALGMGAAVTFVLVCSCALVSCVRKAIPDQVRIPCFIVMIACFSTIVQLLLKAYVPALDASLGIYIPLIVVNCIILERAESFASKNPVLPSIADAIGSGVGFTAALTIIGIIREVLGSGSIFGIRLLPEGAPSILGFIMAPGGFITLGVLLAAVATIENAKKKRLEARREV